MICEACGSSNNRKHGAYRNKTGLYQRYKCNNCGATWRVSKEKKLGKAGLHYTLTPKALLFVEGIKEIARQHGVPEDKIPETLAQLAEYEKIKAHGGSFDHLPEGLQEILRKSTDEAKQRTEPK